MAKRSSSQAERAKRALIKLLLDEPGFVGAGISIGVSGHYEIVILVKDEKSPVLRKAPREWEGIPVRTQIAGVPKKL
jgi:hypothetical protein